MSDLDERYGRRSPMGRRRRRAFAVLGVLAGVVAVALFSVWWTAAQDPFTARVTAFDARSDSVVVVRVEIENRGPDAVRCEIVAQDRNTAVVGSVIVETTAGRRHDVQETRVPTTARAVVAQVRDCSPAPARVP